LALEADAFQIQTAQPGLPSPVPLLFNGVPGQTGAYAGAIVSLYGSNLQASAGATPVVTFGGTTASLLYASPDLINLTIPPGLSPGLTTLLVNNGVGTSYPVTVNIAPPPPVITAIELAPNQLVNSQSPAYPGFAVHILLARFAPTGSTVDPSRVTASVDGISAAANSVTASSSPGVFDVAITVPASVTPGPQVPVIVYLDGRSSTQATMIVAPVPSAGGSK
jgi:uncharacterized protein (TIGR03437 family)